ncbi:D-glycero-alpha-D-manno-heptose-1,7-bisphosphate 7-phosphatase [Pedobacter sp.]|uniref:D-glycero-alpha-D-manno-heptose-1,7-bisphosphate 7-phosphatase n=1 Tax=Pedobacter sp. TaxID=1411316 RepID=UPI003D7F26C0
MAAKRAIFLDKDGTLIPDVPYNVDPAKISLSAEAVEGLQKLQQSGFLLFVISNQAGVAMGYFKETALQPVEVKLQSLMGANNLHLSGFYWCPHHPEALLSSYRIDCNCRKPKPGLIQKAAAAHGIDLSQSWMIGDILNDIEASHRAGCRAVLIENGNETEWKMNELRLPDVIANNINQAADNILNLNKFQHYGISSTDGAI